ncbi:MAG: hypothetical protein RLT05_31820 [Bauldia litoralis]
MRPLATALVLAPLLAAVLSAALPARAADLRFEVGKEGFAVPPASLSCVRWTYDRMRQVVVQVGLDRAAAARLAGLTGKGIGRKMVIVVAGKPVFAATIRERIADGRSQIAGSFTIGDAQTLVGHLGGTKGDCAAFPAPPPDPEKQPE